jgi:hypothetical protein
MLRVTCKCRWQDAWPLTIHTHVVLHSQASAPGKTALGRIDKNHARLCFPHLCPNTRAGTIKFMAVMMVTCLH